MATTIRQDPYGQGKKCVELALEALKRAIEGRNTTDLIHHSDRGIQYASYDYVALLESRDIKISMSAKGNPYENAFIESFFKTLI